MRVGNNVLGDFEVLKFRVSRFDRISGCFRCFILMEGGMPSMVLNVGFGDGLESSNELNERQLLEKLEKSEAGRKKLRQAIALLKEKLDATSQALEVNEALRQEVEKEQLNVDTERKKAEAEKLLREKLEKENFSIKEQFIGVLQRLDSLESSGKADRNELGRIHSEVKEAVGGIGAALQAVEATKGLYQSLERSLHAKINGAVQSSSKALAIAQSGQATTSRAQAAALAAQSLAKSVQKEVQSVSSQIVTLQKHASNLNVLEASLQQELKGPRTPLNSPDAGESNVSLAVPEEKVSIDAAASPNSSAQVTVPTEKSKDDSSEGNMLNMLVASNNRSNPMCSTNGLPPRGGMFLSRNQLPDGGLKTTIPQVRKSPRNGSLEMVSNKEFTPSAQSGSSSLRKGPVAIITGVDSILSPAVRVPETATPSFYITSSSAKAQKQSEVQPPNVSKVPGSTEFSNKRPVVKRGQGDRVQQSKSSADMAEKQITSTAGPLVAFNTFVVEDDDAEGMPQSNDMPYPSTTTKLLKSIIKMFEKEGRNRRSMEDKLMKLQGALESHGDPVQVAQTGTKRKRKEKGDGASREKKRHRQEKESKKKGGNCNVNDAVSSPSKLPCPIEDKHLLQEKENTVQKASGDGEPAHQDRLSKMISKLQDRCRGEGLFETPGDCQVNRDVPGAEECKDASSDIDICNGDDVSKDGTGTNTDLESTDDDMGEEWWAKKVLLSPISSNDLTS